MNQLLWRILSSINSRFIGHDRRVRFRDLARIDARDRSASTSIINFYSSVPNIGNFTPVLGIQQMLGSQPDTWNIHDRDIDFDFINRHYRCAIIGGAGLLDKGFDPFWEKFGQHCTIPAVIWGVGVCAPDTAVEKGVDRAIFARAAEKCDLINVRDVLTADYYRIRHASITPCPTIVYVEKFLNSRKPDGNLLYSSHEELIPAGERAEIRKALTRSAGRIRFTDNIQRPLRGVDDIIRSYYCRSSKVVTTRLHGAIIAYGLGIPYIALARDEKIRAFHRMSGNGVVIEDVTELDSALAADITPTRRVMYVEVRAFADRVKNWLSSLS